jgi:hypothetical protein
MKKRAQKNRNKNTLYAISPYLAGGQWQFDDPSRELYGEALVAGIPEIIQKVCKEKGIQNPEKGFSVVFSSKKFPGADCVLQRVRGESGGNWYKLEGTNMEGWLCPALFKYFENAPSKLYIQVKSC